MNVRSIVRDRFPGCHRFVHRLRVFHRIRRLGHVWFWWMLLHARITCNKPALEGCA